MSNSELATSYAALILADDGVDITVRIPKWTWEIIECAQLLILAGRQAPEPDQGRKDRGR